MSQNVLLNKIFDSFNTSNTPIDAKNKDPMEIINDETEKALENLDKQSEDLQQKIQWLTDTTKSIEELSLHARVKCRPKMSKFVSVDALLNTSEYKLKYGDYTVLSSLKMTTEYCGKSIAGMQEEIASLNEYAERIKDQQLLAHGLTGGKTIEVRHVDNGTLTVYDNGLVEIVETEDMPVEPTVRKAKFRNALERDKYLKDMKEKNVGKIVV